MPCPLTKALAIAGVAWGVVSTGCVRQRPPRPPSRDETLLFEQRRASAEAQSPRGEPRWQSWALYASGRFVYARAGAEPRRWRLDPIHQRTVRAWLETHDVELCQAAPAHDASPTVPGVSATCQLRLSVGLVLAPFGDPRYAACDELRQISLSP
jgi:hypothetical protein